MLTPGFPVQRRWNFLFSRFPSKLKLASAEAPPENAFWKNSHGDAADVHPFAAGRGHAGF
jgi:hypothetical protein